MTQGGETGFLLRCHLDGRIMDVLHDGSGRVSPSLMGRPFTMLVQPAGLAKALDFFAGIHRDGAQYLWELPTLPHGEVMVFIGVFAEDAIAIAASSTHEGLRPYVDELVRINNEQANLIRQLYAERRVRPSPTSTPTSTLDAAQFMRLNNDFANAQRELAKKNAELERALKWRGLVMGMAAHDLRNPLSTISGYADLLTERLSGSLGEMERRALGHISQSGAYMLRIIEDVMDFAQIETGHFSMHRVPMDIAGLIRQAILQFSNSINQRRIQLQMDVPDEPVMVLADGGRMMQVLTNLLSNAVKYTPTGGHITVMAQNSSQGAVIQVIDSGPGIPAGERDRLFKPFSRTSVPSATGEGGTGLGLAIIQSIVEGHGGAITVDSAAQQGACFIVTLPPMRP